jgi:glycosyltransferase involved in cell wall biosynthesis
VKVRTYNVFRQLARQFDVTALCFYRWKNGALNTDVRLALDGLAGLGRFEAFAIPQEHNRARLLWDHARSAASGRAYTVFAYESRDFRARLRHLLQSEPFDLAHVDSLDLSAYFPALGRLPFACVHHDVQSHLLGRRAMQQESTARRAYIAHQAKLMEREERRWLPLTPLTVAVSEVDRGRLQSMAPAARITVVPNGVDLDFFTQRPEAGTGLVFVGGSTWFPNLDGMSWFGQAVVPELARLGVTASVRWVGRTTPGEADRFRKDFGIQAVGYVDDIRDHVAAAQCFIVPLRVGGGTRIKILDAWAMGKAIVSTTIGCEGLDARDGENMLIRDEPGAFAEAVRLVLADADLRRRLGEAGRRTVEERYSWDAIGREMNKTYLGMMD